MVLRCGRDEVVPGETVDIRGKTVQAYQVPADAKPGTRHWVELEGAWTDFTVVPLVDATLELADALRLRLVPRLAAAAEATVTLAGQTKTARWSPAGTSRSSGPFIGRTRRKSASCLCASRPAH